MGQLYPVTTAILRVKGQQNTNFETYIVCLECGHHVAYDWTNMRTNCRAPQVAGPDHQRTIVRTERIM